MSFWVYILHCADSSYYTGHTEELESRIAQHQSGEYCSYTMNRRPVNLVYAQEFPTRLEALESEQQIKGWGRAKKKALIDGNWMEISRLAKRK